MQDFVKIQRHLAATILLSLILRANAFSYKDAKNWGKKYPECNGKNQSPIRLDPPGTDSPSIDKLLIFTNFNKLPKNVTIGNNGHTVEVKAHWSGKPPTLTGGPLHGDYVFEKSTFHWSHEADEKFTYKDGDDNDSHTHPRPYSLYMEMHMFFYRADLKSFEKAQSQKGGLAAFQVWIRGGYELDQEHVFDNLEKNLHKVRSPNSTAVIPPFRLTSILTELVVPIDFYEGSLDYPPCSESVTWFIYEPDVPITDGLRKEFRKIKLANGDVSNVRPNQPLNHRQPKNVNGDDGKYE